MNLARWFALGFVGLLLVCTGGFLIVREEIAAAQSGYVPRVCRGVQERIVARSATSELDGPIQHIVAHGNEVVLVAPHTWMVAVDGQILGPFGNAQRGAPGHLGNPQDAAITDTAIFFLDAAGHAIRVFAKTGAFERTIALPRSPSAITELRQLFVVDNQLYLTAFQVNDAGAEWMVLRLAGNTKSFQAVYATPGSSVNGIAVDYSSGRIAIGEMSSYRITIPAADSSEAKTLVREAAPLHPFNASERRRYRSYWSKLPPSTRAAFDLPSYVPPLVGLRRISNDYFAALLTHDVDRVHVELLDHSAKPICRMTEAPIERPVGLGAEGFYYVVEEAEELLLKFAEYAYAADD